jgi:hypothetical protein
MKTKAIIITAVVIVLALGVIGAAYATGMNIVNIGALSAGQASMEQVNTDDVGFLSSADGLSVDRVALSFESDLPAGSTIWVKIVGKTASGWKVLGSALAEENETIVILSPPLAVSDIPSSNNVMVTVAER